MHRYGETCPDKNASVIAHVRYAPFLWNIVFLLFQEPSEGLVISSDAPEFGTDKEGRRCWSVLDFAERHNLTLVGANFFTLSAD